MLFVFLFVICNVLLVQCGNEDPESKDKLEFRILYGSPASITEFPYFANIGNCGAAIISDRWLITAAHCLHEGIPRTATVGGENEYNSITVNIDQGIVYPYFKHYQLLNNDVALLRLSRPLTFSAKIMPVRLPQVDSVSGVHKFVGKGADESGGLTNSIMKVDLVRLTPQQCLNRLQRNLRGHVEGYLEKTMICVKRIEQLPSVCSGDSGAPLAVDNTLVGLTSFLLNVLPNGEPDCVNAPVAFFTKVIAYVPWIKYVTGLQ